MEREGMLDGPGGARLTYALLDGWDPCLVFLPGFASDMQGTKALSLRDFCAERGQAMLRLDYSGHGASAGCFEDGTISAWTADAEAVIREAAPERRLILAGSSMGGWIALLLALRLKGRVAGLVGIAAAPDFTEELIRPSLTEEQKARLKRDGVLMQPNPYGSPTPITARLLEDGARHLLLRGPIPLSCPIRLLHGQRDEDVPWQTSLRIAELAESEDVRVTLVKDGDHRLSRPQDLALLLETIRDVSDDCSSGGEADAG
ncbi:MAG TPA: alpha/beta hydrolase [Acetobacteraceae bacterium]|nr:alpha/beta hydrolase [Acetobacteraceae bacterium]